MTWSFERSEPVGAWIIVAVALSSGCDTTGERSAAVDAFVAAWADGRYDDAYQLTGHYYREKVSAEQFARGMQAHPFVSKVRGGSIKPVGRRYHVGVLQTDAGEVGARFHVCRRDDVWLICDAETWPGEYSLLSPWDENTRRMHTFLKALVDRSWPDAFELTHPTFRRQVDVETFAKTYADNVWLLEATGFRLKWNEGARVGEILQMNGMVKIVLHTGDQNGLSWVTEIVIGGTPTMPKPKHVDVTYEAQQ